MVPMHAGSKQMHQLVSNTELYGKSTLEMIEEKVIG